MSRASKKAQRSGSNVFSIFSPTQIAEFKEAFTYMDADKDGIISKNDLRATYNQVGRIASDSELDEMLKEASGPINMTQLLTIFANRMAGGGTADDDTVVANAFKAFDEGGSIDAEKLKLALTTFGDKFTIDEVEDAYEQLPVSGGKINTAGVISLLTASEKEEGAAA